MGVSIEKLKATELVARTCGGVTVDFRTKRSGFNTPTIITSKAGKYGYDAEHEYGDVAILSRNQAKDILAGRRIHVKVTKPRLSCCGGWEPSRGGQCLRCHSTGGFEETT